MSDAHRPREERGRLPSLLFGFGLLSQINDIALDHAGRLCAGRIALRHQGAVVSTADNLKAVCPLHGSLGITTDLTNIGETVQGVVFAHAGNSEYHRV